MADKTPDYTVSRRKLELEILQHRDTIARGLERIEGIERAKALNLGRAEIANMDLDSEASSIRANQAALEETIKEIETNLELMVTPTEELTPNV